MIENRFIYKGWITLSNSSDGDVDTGIYCCLVHKDYLVRYLKDRSWGLQKGAEGKPTIYTTFANGNDKNLYHAFREGGIEPFLFYRYFGHNGERYYDVSEDFVNYFKLYEKISTKQQRTYYFIDDIGHEEEVLVIN